MSRFLELYSHRTSENWLIKNLKLDGLMLRGFNFVLVNLLLALGEIVLYSKQHIMIARTMHVGFVTTDFILLFSCSGICVSDISNGSQQGT